MKTTLKKKALKRKALEKVAKATGQVSYLPTSVLRLVNRDYLDRLAHREAFSKAPIYSSILPFKALCPIYSRSTPLPLP